MGPICRPGLTKFEPKCSPVEFIMESKGSGLQSFKVTLGSGRTRGLSPYFFLSFHFFLLLQVLQLRGCSKFVAVFPHWGNGGTESAEP